LNVTSGAPLYLYSVRRIEPEREHDVKPYGKLWHTALGALLAAIAVGSLPARADDFPSRPVTLVIPFTAGGPADTAARTISEVLRHHLGQPIIAENRPAASGIPGTEAVARGEADGYTLLLGGIAALTLIPPVQKVHYDVARDFAPLGLIWRSPQVFAVRRDLNVRTVAEFVAYAKAHPGKVTIGSAGTGTVTDLAGELVARESGVTLVHVPYRSTANSLTDLIGGHIDAIFGDAAILQPHAISGTIRALAVTSARRSPLLPDLVTMEEAGFADVRTEVWYGLLASARTPAPILGKLKAAVAAAQSDPVFAESLARYGVRPSAPGSEAFAKFIAEEAARWTPVVTSMKAN
jgi:tripartite-type tricarboxylate transporter receptor subunit TctC